MHRSLATVVLASVSLVASAQPEGLPPLPPEEISDACSDEARRQFDFWLGRWSVAVPGRPPRAVNEITRAARGCALHEHYYNAEGYTGNSVNFFDGDTRTWNQLWVDSSGLVLRLAGGLDSQGRMVLTGTRTDSSGQTLNDRITWIPQTDGSVRQVWDTSRDGGWTWENFFTGEYVRLPASPGDGR